MSLEFTTQAPGPDTPPDAGEPTSAVPFEVPAVDASQLAARASRFDDAIRPTLDIGAGGGRESAFETTFVPESMWLPSAGPSAAATTGDTTVAPDLDPSSVPFDAGPEFRTLGTLGEGGMGVVHLADQRRLRREVAVKRIRPERSRAGSGPDGAGIAERARAELLREAWVMGSLEHPNIVPVHTLARAEDGGPILVMKRIEGTHWLELLRRDRTAAAEDDAGAVSERRPRVWHLRVLDEVCNAIRFAHSRGIVHRDLKPENVMIGSFGEVYVLDWGIAVSLDPADRGRVLLASEVQGLAGTPAYMAPEMVDGDPPTRRTDVYLLGAILHEILAGEPPHSGANLIEVLESAYCSAPHAYGPDVPAELVAICHRAMHPEPSARFADAGEFQDVLRAYLEHRESTALAHTARARLDDLRSAAEHAGEGALSDVRRGTIHRAFDECRFGFAQALEMWPENPLARRGLRDAFEVMIDVELERGDADSAGLLMDELVELSSTRSASIPTDLLDKLERVRTSDAARRQAVARMEARERELDITAADAFRARVALMVAIVCIGPGIVWTAAELVGWVSYTTFTSLGLIGAVVIECLVGAWFFRRKLIQNEMSLRFAVYFVVLMFLLFVHELGAWMRGLDAVESLGSLPVVGVSGMAAVGILVDRRILPLAWLYGACYVAVSVAPAGVPLIIAVTNFVACMILWFTWRRAPAEAAD